MASNFNVHSILVSRFLLFFIISFPASLAAGTWSVIPQAGKTTASITPGSAVSIQGTDEFNTWFESQSLESGEVLVYMNGQLLVNATLRLRNAETSLYVFDFSRSAISSSIWPAIRARAPGSPYLSRNIDLAFGDSQSIHWNQGTQSVQLILIRTKMIVAWGLVIVCLLIFFLNLTRKSNILRAGRPPIPDEKPPMSLARTQMAFWLFVIVSSYVWIWLITGNLHSTNETVLILLGIASGTYLGAVFIEGSSGEVTVNEGTVGDADELPATDHVMPIRKRETKWFMQLLSDNTGVKLHRFQILTWTVVLGGIFIVETIKSLSMPSFPPSLLGLLGISTSTYLGFKFPELKGQDQTVKQEE